MSKILSADPGAAYRGHQAEIDAAVRRVLDSGWYVLGNEVKSFEQEFADYCGTSHAVGVGNGTDALELALRCCDIGPGDLVATVANTAVATVAAIELAGAEPILVDIDADTFTMNVDSLRAAIEAGGKSLRAVIPVHLYGHPADMNAIMEIAERHGLIVIEDCAQAHGAIRAGRMAGSVGQMSAFSFYPTKNLGALGDGGAVVTNDAALAEKARLLQQYGWQQRYVSKLPGMNTRLDEIQAAVLRAKLPYLDRDNERRGQIAKIYDRHLGPIPGLAIPHRSACDRHVFHQYTIKTKKRDELMLELRRRDIGAAVLYPEPIHLQEAYAGRLKIAPLGLPATESVVQEILCLPVHPSLIDQEVLSVVEAVQSFYHAAREAVV